MAWKCRSRSARSCLFDRAIWRVDDVVIGCSAFCVDDVLVSDARVTGADLATFAASWYRLPGLVVAAPGDCHGLGQMAPQIGIESQLYAVAHIAAEQRGVSGANHAVIDRQLDVEHIGWHHSVRIGLWASR